LNQVEYQSASLLRFLAAGSVDDGKSTLIGRLLYDSRGIYEDQLASIRTASERHLRGLDLSLLTDGLRAEREQGITIDVAYRYFATSRRKFIIADVPGHEQYTRNMATGASTADVMVLLIDVTKGILSQTRRHAHIGSLFGIAHIAVAINKMDLVAFDEQVYHRACLELERLMAALGFASSTFIPISALEGDNVTTKSHRMKWYEGPSLLEFLEEVPVQRLLATKPFRLPVQLVIRSRDARGYAGQIISGKLRRNQEVILLPTHSRARIESISVGPQDLSEAVAPCSVVVSLNHNLDVSRGDMLADAKDAASPVQHFRATLIWLSSAPLTRHGRYFLKHTTKTVCAFVKKINHRIDIDTFERVNSETLHLNDIGEVEIQTHKSIYCDVYGANRATGSFILIDPVDNRTAGAGMISHLHPDDSTAALSRTHEGAILWLTGLSGAGKTTIAMEVLTELLARGFKVELLDGDVVRKDLSRDLGFSKADREENIRRIGVVAGLLARNGIIVLVSAISPYRTGREEVRNRFPVFLEVFVNAPLSVCEQRDPKGLYRKAREGLLFGFTGLHDPYERPLSPDVECKTDRETLRDCVEKVVTALLTRLEHFQI
jgi:bifunctional enzyme CysN/CysC